MTQVQLPLPTSRRCVRMAQKRQEDAFVFAVDSIIVKVGNNVGFRIKRCEIWGWYSSDRYECTATQNAEENLIWFYAGDS